MTNNYERALDAIKAKNGGVLPSDLYVKTNAELGKILYNLTGDSKYTMNQRVSKESLVKRIQKLTEKTISPKVSSMNAVSGVKRTRDDDEENTPKPVKVPRNVLRNITEVQFVQMKRILSITPGQLDFMKHEKDLRPLWADVGMTSKYPAMTGKEKVMERLKTFSENNLTFYNRL
mmetsp:Transcript_20119/g.27726  ORF Transcript_20119/g.27726 Transcript_20119/m.27726 type:complete len:175 (-) Transcript_20119:27-551(-)